MEGTEESAEAGRACGAEGQREAVVEERLQWFGVAGALGQAVASGDGAGEGRRAARRAGCQPPDGGWLGRQQRGEWLCLSGAAGPAVSSPWGLPGSGGLRAAVYPPHVGQGGWEGVLCLPA